MKGVDSEFSNKTCISEINPNYKEVVWRYGSWKKFNKNSWKKSKLIWNARRL